MTLYPFCSKTGTKALPTIPVPPVIKTVLALSIIKNNVAVAKLFYAMMQKKPPGIHREEQLKRIICLSLASRESVNQAFCRREMY